MDDGAGGISVSDFGGVEVLPEVALPEDFSRFRVQGVHEAGETDRVDDAVVDERGGAGSFAKIGVDFFGEGGVVAVVPEDVAVFRIEAENGLTFFGAVLGEEFAANG